MNPRHTRPAQQDMAYIGQPIPRLEDLRLVTGKGRYTDDVAPPNACWAFVLRSPHAHADLRAIHADQARRRPGVLAILTAADSQADGLGTIPHLANPAGAVDPARPTFVNGS